ncbi:toll/interleukin-1 receptor domain-containing protein [Nocardia gamkensis]|uniref:toll/interleukin-1 receptor domain-containing protein n=1 Tax=Nocardia gamkensis TaxID=352869 RepID=UPI003403994E
MSIAFEQPPVRCFISYRRDDNAAFLNVVDRLKADLSGRFEAATGRKLEIFVDRDDIGWGEDWRERINSSIRQATFFIPILTARYFDSIACREEFLAFYENANKLGVTELVTPIILAGMTQLQGVEKPEPAGIAMGLQCVRIDEDFLDGFESAAWNRKIHAMVLELERALTRAETSLANQEHEAIAPEASTRHTVPVDGSDEAAESVGDFLDMQEKIDNLKIQLPKVTEDFSELINLMGTMDEDFFKLSPPRQRVTLLQLAKDIEQPALSFQESAGSLQRDASAIDAQVRMLLQEFSEMESEQGRQMGAVLLSGFDGLEGAEEIRQQMTTASDAFHTAGMFNVNLRRAIRPALLGARSLQTVLDIFVAWRSLRNGDS